MATHAPRPQRLLRSGMALGILGLLVLAALVFPAGGASPTVPSRFVGVYLDDPKVTLLPPTGSQDKTRSIGLVPAPGAPAVATPGVFTGSTRFEGQVLLFPLKAASDVAAELWLSSPQSTPITSVRIELVKIAGSSNTVLATLGSGGLALRGADASPQTTLGPTPIRVMASGAFDNPGTEHAAGALVGLNVAVAALGVQGQPVDVVLHYGSAQHPSGVAFAVRNDPGPATLGAVTGVYLDEGKLSLAEPTAAADKKRSAGNTGNSLQDAPEWIWGTATASSELRILSDAVLNVTLQLGGAPPQAAVRLVLQANLYFGAVAYEASTNYAPAAVATTPVSNAQPVKLSLAFPTHGLTVLAGTTIKIGFRLYSEQPGAAFDFLYGSAKRPAGVVFATPAPAQLTASAAPSSLPVTAGAGPDGGLSTPDNESAAPASASAPGKSPAFTLGLLGVGAGLVVVALRRRR